MTTEVKISTLGAELVLPADSLTNGTANAEVHFTFDETWATYDGKTAVFSNELQTVQAEINGEGIALIPPVILATLWRFVSVAVSAEGVGAYSPFVRIGQVLPSGKDGQDGQFVTFEQLQQILLGYVKAEDLGIYATKEELEAARAALAAEIAGKADQAAVDAQAAEIETLTRAVGANTTAISGNTTAIATKANQADLEAAQADIAANAAAIATKADKAELAGYWSKAEIGLQTSGDGTKYLADDGTYKPVHGGGGDEKTFIAEYNVTTAQEIVAFLDAAKEPFAPMLVKRGNDYYTVTTAAIQALNRVIIRTFATLSGNYYMFTYTVTDGTWASSSYGFQKLLESGTNIKTINGQSLLGSGDIPIQGGAQVQANWNETDDTSPAYIQNKPTIPDVSGFETTEHAAVTYATKDDISGFVKSITYQQLPTITDAADENGKVTLSRALCGEYSHPDAETPGNYTATKAVIRFPQRDGVSGSLPISFEYGRDGEGNYGFKNVKIDNAVLLTETDAAKIYAAKSEIITVTTGSGTLFLADDGTYKPASGDPPDLSAYLTKTEAGETYATKSELDAKADRTQLQGYLTKMEASETYETIARASKIKSLTAAGHAVTVTDEGLANVGGTKVTKASTSPQIGVSDVSIAVQQILPATEEATTGEGETLPITYTSTTSGALTEYSNFTIDGVPIATKDDLTAGESPIKSITAGTLPVTLDPNGDAQVGRTAVNVSSVAETAKLTTNVLISETLPSTNASTTNEGGKFGVIMGIGLESQDLETLKFGWGGSGNQTIQNYYELPTRKWIQEYIQSLDANNVGY